MFMFCPRLLEYNTLHLPVRVNHDSIASDMKYVQDIGLVYFQRS
jgi:hypothetical protein